jgi:AcrR family transcriptional regulator
VVGQQRAPSCHPPYELAQQQGQDVLRRTLLDVASRLLVGEDPQALTMRRVAATVGCSTTVLYTAFGSKDGLAEALFLEGFQRLRRRLEAVPSSGERTLARSSIAFAPILVSAGFFFSTLSPRAERPNGAIALVYLGAVLLAVGAVTLGVGL